MTAPPTVAVQATAQLEVAPDSFVLYASVTGGGADSAAALSDLAGRYLRLEEATAALPPSVTVRHGRLHSWADDPRRNRWRAERTATVTGRDTAAVAAVAEMLAAVAGVTLNGPEWLLDRDNAAYADVQQDAVAQARARAQRYATALGGSLGRLVEISDPESAHVVFGARAASAVGRAEASGLGLLDFGPQHVTISATVHARWYLVLPE